MSKKLRRSILYWLLLSPLIVLILFPFAVMLITALKPQTEVLNPTWWPSDVRWRNFIDMWDAAKFGPALVNSLYVSIVSTLLALLVLGCNAPREIEDVSYDDRYGRAKLDLYPGARINLKREGNMLLVSVPDGAEARLELNFVASAAASVGTSYPRVQVHAGRASRLRIVVRHLSDGAADSAVNAAFDLALATDASIDHCRLQNCADGASVFDTLTAHVGERATYRLRMVTLGGLTIFRGLTLTLSNGGPISGFDASMRWFG